MSHASTSGVSSASSAPGKEGRPRNSWEWGEGDVELEHSGRDELQPGGRRQELHVPTTAPGDPDALRMQAPSWSVPIGSIC